MSEEMFPPDLPYPSNVHGKAPTLVQLGYIFLYIMGGIDFIAVPVLVVYIFFIPEIMKAGGPGAGPSPPPAFLAMMGVMLGICAFVSLLQGILKMIAATKLRKQSRHAWGWGLAAGIAACTQIQCSFCCVLPLAMGIYLIVILCRADVQNYLRAEPEKV
jgi:hypothetical protein